MHKIIRILMFVAVMTAALMSQAAVITNYDSIVSLATSVTKNYTFTDTYGQNLVIAVTMTPYSSSNASPSFTLLDNYGGNGFVHLGIDSGLGGGDGNWIDNFEGVNFEASLVSASSGILTNSIQFNIGGIGVRLGGGAGDLNWTSSAGTNSLMVNSEIFVVLDQAMAGLAGATYSGQLRLTDDGEQIQLSDFGPLSGQSIQLNAMFVDEAGLNSTKSDKIYVASGSGSIEVYGTNGIGSVFATIPGSEQGTVLDSAGNLYVVDQDFNLIEKFDTNGVGSVFATNLNNPIGLTIDSANNVYVNNYNDSSIWKYTPAGVGMLFGYGYGNLQGMAFDGATNLYVAEYDQNDIRKFDASGSSVVFASNNISGPQGITFDGAGNLYVANNNLNTIEKFSPAGADLGVFADTDNGAYGLAFDSVSNLYVTTYDSTIQKIAPNGTITEFAYDSSAPAYLAIWPGLKPAAVAVGGSFSSFSYNNGQFQFYVSGIGGAEYVIEATTNLTVPNWNPILTNAAPFTFIESNTASYSQRYYRAVSAQ